MVMNAMHKNEHRFERERPVATDSSSRTLWAISGASAEFSEITSIEARLMNHLVAASHPAFVEHDDLDYVEIPHGDTPTERIPLSWGGLSGAGLWLCHLRLGGDNEPFEVVPLLSGVTFFQKRIADRRGTIRCHGPASLRSHCLDLVR
jgi:hypothetical protein